MYVLLIVVCTASSGVCTAIVVVCVQLVVMCVQLAHLCTSSKTTLVAKFNLLSLHCYICLGLIVGLCNKLKRKWAWHRMISGIKWAWQSIIVGSGLWTGSVCKSGYRPRPLPTMICCHVSCS